jgi:SAM-dependent methyltransferase
VRLNDLAYLRDRQYAQPDNLDARANLHRRYGRNDWFAWLAAQVERCDGARVLEIGCGPGWFWDAAGAALPRRLDLVLTDLSEGMVTAALGRAKRADWAVRGQAVDATRLPFESGVFDVVLACHMLYHVPEPPRAIAEIARVLKPGGVAAITTNGKRHLAELFEIEAEVWPGEDRAREMDLFGLENGAELLAPAFRQVELRRHQDDLTCTDPADVEAYIVSSPPGSEATMAKRVELRAAIARRFAADGGAMKVGKAAGLFLCRKPISPSTD